MWSAWKLYLVQDAAAGMLMEAVHEDCLLRVANNNLSL